MPATTAACGIDIWKSYFGSGTSPCLLLKFDVTKIMKKVNKISKFQIFEMYQEVVLTQTRGCCM